MNLITQSAINSNSKKLLDGFVPTLFAWLLQTSKCCEEIKEYIQAGVEEDILVKGIAEDKNPFKEKGGCVIC